MKGNKTNRNKKALKTRMKECRRCFKFFNSTSKRGFYCVDCAFPNRRKK